VRETEPIEPGGVEAEKRTSSRARAAWAIVREAYDEWDRDNATSLAAALAYYAAFATAPTLVILVAVLGALVGRSHVRAQILEYARTAMGHEGEAAVVLLLDHAPSLGSSVVATVVGVVLILVTTSGFFAELSRSLDVIFNVEEPRPSSVWALVKERAVAFTMVLFGGGFLLATMLSSTLLASLGGLLPAWGPALHLLVRVASGVVGLALLAGLFGLVVKILPRTRVATRDLVVGSCLTAVLFALGSALIGVYFAKSTVASSFGAAGGFAVFLAWVYYSAQIFFFGAELTQVIAARRKAGRLTSADVAPPSRRIATAPAAAPRDEAPEERLSDAPRAPS
jgi:membrane protein